MAEKKISPESLHREVKKWTQALGKKMMEDQLVLTQTLLAEKTSTPKESPRVSLLDMVTQKLFDRETPAGRNLEL